MSILCAMLGHTADATRHHNQGLDFSICHHCRCDLIRAADGEWGEVPKGFRVVWREFGRPDEAAGVAQRMHRISAGPARRRAPRNAAPAPRRDRRGKRFAAAAGMLSALSNLNELMTGPEQDVSDAVDVNSQLVIRLPQASNAMF